MNKNLFNFLNILLVIILLDQMSKNLALDASTYVANQGMMFGSFSKTSPVVRISLITSGSIIFFIIYMGLLYFLSNGLAGLKVAISLLFGGALSNAIDKVYLNFVVDFIPISIGDYLFHANVSDIFQLVGVGIIFYYIFLCQDEIWFPNDKRGQILISPKAQIIFAAKFFIVSVLSLLMISLFSYTYMDLEFAQFSFAKKSEYIKLASMLSLIFGMLIFTFGIFLSHHFYGPIYKLNKYVQDSLWDEEFRLRERDQFKELEALIEKIKKR